jgi:hypothetical protein
MELKKLEPYPKIEFRFCCKCQERYGQNVGTEKVHCRNCKFMTNIISSRLVLSNNIKNKLIQLGKEERGPRKVVFLCMRFSSIHTTTKEEQFKQIYDSIIDSEK